MFVGASAIAVALDLMHACMHQECAVLAQPGGFSSDPQYLNQYPEVCAGAKKGDAVAVGLPQAGTKTASVQYNDAQISDQEKEMGADYVKENIEQGKDVAMQVRSSRSCHVAPGKRETGNTREFIVRVGLPGFVIIIIFVLSFVVRLAQPASCFSMPTSQAAKAAQR